MSTNSIQVIDYTKLLDYFSVWQAMKQLVAYRSKNHLYRESDQLWVLEHNPVFTLGLAGDLKHIIKPVQEIPVIKSDRGGQVTYHGPGQLIIYPILNLKHNQLKPRRLVTTLENSVLKVLKQCGVDGHTKPNAPGIYVHNAKIASLGLRMSQGYSYHGISLNYNLDLAPFSSINPCGYPDQLMINLVSLTDQFSKATIKKLWIKAIIDELGYNSVSFLSADSLLINQ